MWSDNRYHCDRLIRKRSFLELETRFSTYNTRVTMWSVRIPQTGTTDHRSPSSNSAAMIFSVVTPCYRLYIAVVAGARRGLARRVTGTSTEHVAKPV